MGSRYSKISSGQLALNALDRAQIEGLIREAIALLVESGQLQIPPSAAFVPASRGFALNKD